MVSRLPADVAERVLSSIKQQVSDSRNDPDFVQQPEPTTQPVEASATPEPVSVPPVETQDTTTQPEPVQTNEPPSEEPTEQPPVETPEPTSQTNWDDIETPITPTEPIQSSDLLRQVGSALGVEVKTEAELIEKVKQLKEPKKIQDPELQTLIDLHEQGIDWRTQLSTVDYSKVDPIQLFEQDLRNDPRFKNPDGSFNEERYLEELDATPQAVRAAVGRQIAQALNFQQSQQRAAQERQAEEARVRFDHQLAQAVSRLGQLLPYESHGIKFEERHSSELYRGLSDGSLMRELFLDNNGKYDPDKIVITAAWRKWGPQIVKHMASKSSVATKRDILDRTQVPQLHNPRTPAAPEPPPTPSEKTPEERAREYAQRGATTGRL